MSGSVKGGSSSSNAMATPVVVSTPRDPKDGPLIFSRRTLEAYKSRIDKRMKEQQQHGRVISDKDMDGAVGKYASLVSRFDCLNFF